jgi:hypothetical protein
MIWDLGRVRATGRDDGDVVVEIEQEGKKAGFVLCYQLAKEDFEELMASFAGEVLVEVLLFEASEVEEDIDDFIVAVEAYKVEVK